ncbi:hypothetical protein ACFLSJ_02790 [Verrucomicrobiota bacterium]
MSTRTLAVILVASISACAVPALGTSQEGGTGSAGIAVHAGQLAWPRPALLVPALPTAPVLDGRAEDAAWARAAGFSLSFPLDGNEAVSPDTTCRIGHFEGVLYLFIAIAWDEPEPPQCGSSGRDPADLWKDPGGEVFFVDTSDLTRARQVLFNLVGGWGDVAVSVEPDPDARPKLERDWDPDWQIARATDGDHCHIEMALPCREIVGVDGKPGDIFRFDVVRSVPGREHAIVHWAPIPGRRNCRPEHFGFAVLTGPDPSRLSWEDLPAPSLRDALISEIAGGGVKLSGRPLHALFQCPLVEAVGQGPPGVFRAALISEDGIEFAFREFPALGSFAIEVQPPGDGRYELVVRSKQYEQLKTTSLVRWAPWVVVEAEDPLVCRREGPVYIEEYPRTVGQKVAAICEGGRLSMSTDAGAVYLRLSTEFTPPGPWYGTTLTSQLAYAIDGRTAGRLDMARCPREMLLAQNLPPGEHTVVLEAVADDCSVDGFRLAARSLSEIRGLITTLDYAELLVDVRAEVFREGRRVRTEYVRSPHDGGSFSILGLPPARYRLRLIAAGWEPFEIPKVVVEREGQIVDVGVVALTGGPLARLNATGPMSGRTISVTPGGTFHTALKLWREPLQFQLVSPHRSLPVGVEDLRRLEYGQHNRVYAVALSVPADAPRDMYDLEIVVSAEEDGLPARYPQAVCVRDPLPAAFYLGGVGHMNTWGQKTSEYLAKVGEMAQLAGARALLVANEVNPAYVWGALRHLQIPYSVTRGNHSTGRWAKFFGHGSMASDDGPMRIVTFGGFPYESWAEVRELLRRRPEASARVLLCYEGFAPPDLIREGQVDILFDGHSDDPHPDLSQFPERTLHFRAPNQYSMRWIPMAHDGLAPAVATVHGMPVLEIPRDGPAPLRAQFSAPNNGTASSLTATVINAYDVPFPAGRLRFVMRKGQYGVTGGVKRQSFDSDDGEHTVVDVKIGIPAGSEITVSVALATTHLRFDPGRASTPRPYQSPL